MSEKSIVGRSDIPNTFVFIIYIVYSIIFDGIRLSTYIKFYNIRGNILTTKTCQPR